MRSFPDTDIEPTKLGKIPTSAPGPFHGLEKGPGNEFGKIQKVFMCAN